jgi:hypothetical protein
MENAGRNSYSGRCAISLSVSESWGLVGEDAVSNGWRRRSKFISGKFKPYALATGQLNLAWNDLHEVLGRLFVDAMAIGQQDMGLRLRLAYGWGLISSDRQRRILLEATINRIGKDEHLAFPQLATNLSVSISLTARPIGQIDRAKAGLGFHPR